MDIKKQTSEETSVFRQAVLHEKDKEDEIFYLKDNVDIKVVKHGDLYEDQNKTKVRYAVCCPEYGEIVFLDSGSRTSENTGDPESDVFSSEKITYSLVCSSCSCSFKTTEHIKNTAWSIIFAVYVPIVVCLLSFLLIPIEVTFKQDKITFISLIVFAFCLLWLIALYILAYISGNSNDDE